MKDSHCVAFLQWALPRLRLRWEGFRKVRRQVCRRIARRIDDLGLPDIAAYRARLEANAGEWPVLEPLCRVTISRFYRDRRVFDVLRERVLPSLGPDARAWCAGCASGEEPYTLKIASPGLRIVATDIDPALLERARRACFTRGSLRELPREWLKAFDERFCVREPYRDIDFRLQDIRRDAPEGPFDLVLCRNLAFTYFDEELQRDVLDRITDRLRPGGVLVIGIHESLPDARGFEAWDEACRIYQRTPPVT